MSQAVDGTGCAAAYAALGQGERLAVWTLRRIVHGARSCGLSGDTASRRSDIAADLARMADCLRDVLAQQRRSGLRPLRIDPPGSLCLTRDERRLLKAVAAAQADETGVLDNHLYRLALVQPARTRLAEAMTILAAALAVQGHWIPQPAMPVPHIAPHAMQARHIPGRSATWGA
jgi:hypothetical protein